MTQPATTVLGCSCTVPASVALATTRHDTTAASKDRDVLCKYRLAFRLVVDVIFALTFAVAPHRFSATALAAGAKDCG